MSTNETARKVLRVLSSEFRWTQGVLARDGDGVPVQPTDKLATCWCICGATQKVTDRSERIAFYDAFHVRYNQTISRFNDTHTYGEVIAALEALTDGP